jgi:hypothetical protein
LAEFLEQADHRVVLGWLVREAAARLERPVIVGL